MTARAAEKFERYITLYAKCDIFVIIGWFITQKKFRLISACSSYEGLKGKYLNISSIKIVLYKEVDSWDYSKMHLQCVKLKEKLLCLKKYSIKLFKDIIFDSRKCAQRLISFICMDCKRFSKLILLTQKKRKTSVLGFRQQLNTTKAFIKPCWNICPICYFSM